ncbi:MAG: hypothetical protein WAN86_10820 [Hyphomicrobiaceae bacterium]
MGERTACDPALVGTLALTLTMPNRSVAAASKPEILSIGFLLLPTAGISMTTHMQHVVGRLVRLAQEAFRADRRAAAILATLAIDHVDTLDGAVPAPEVERPGAIASPYHATHVKLVGIAVRIHDRDSHDLDVAAPCRQPYGPVTAVASADADRIAIPSIEGHLPAAKLNPLAVALRHGIGHDHSGAYERGQRRATES